MSLPANLVNRIYGWFPFPVPLHTEPGSGYQFNTEFGDGTIHPIGFDEIELLSFMFWRVQKWALHLEFSGSQTITYVSDGHTYSYTGTASGSLDGVLDLAVDATWFTKEGHPLVTDPIQLIGLQDDVPYHELKKDFTAGTRDWAWDGTPDPHGSLPANGPAATRVSIGLFSGNYSSAFNDRIVYKDGLYYPQLAIDIQGSPNVTILSFYLGENNTDGSPPWPSAGSIEFRDMGGTPFGSIALGQIDAHASWAVSGYLKPDTLW